MKRMGGKNVIALRTLFIVIIHSTEQGADLSCASHHNTAISGV